MISLSAVVVVAAGLWLGNLLDWAGYTSPLPRFNKTEVVVEEAAADTLATEAAVAVEEVAPEASPAE